MLATQPCQRNPGPAVQFPYALSVCRECPGRLFPAPLVLPMQLQITPDWEKFTAKVEADPDLVKTLGWVRLHCFFFTLLYVSVGPLPQLRRWAGGDCLMLLWQATPSSRRRAARLCAGPSSAPS